MPSLKRVLDAHTSKPSLNTIIRRHTVRKMWTATLDPRLLPKEVRRGHDNAR